MAVCIESKISQGFYVKWTSFIALNGGWTKSLKLENGGGGGGAGKIARINECPPPSFIRDTRVCIFTAHFDQILSFSAIFLSQR